MERIAGNAVVSHEVQHRLSRPVEQWIELEQAMLGVEFDNSHFRAMSGLIPAQAGDPGFGPAQSPVERLDLSDIAAGGASLPRTIEPIDALPRDEFFERVVARIDGSDAPIKAAFALGPQLVGLGNRRPVSSVTTSTSAFDELSQ